MDVVGVGLVFVVIVVLGIVEIMVAGKLPRPPSENFEGEWTIGFAVVLRLAALVVDMVVDVVGWDEKALYYTLANC